MSDWYDDGGDASGSHSACEPSAPSPSEHDASESYRSEDYQSADYGSEDHGAQDYESENYQTEDDHGGGCAPDPGSGHEDAPAGITSSAAAPAAITSATPQRPRLPKPDQLPDQISTALGQPRTPNPEEPVSRWWPRRPPDT